MRGYTSNFANGLFNCICDYNLFNLNVEMNVLNQWYCCPVGSTIINQACGCDSTGSSKVYLATVTLNLNPLAINALTMKACVP